MGIPALYSKYIINGIPQELVPAQILADCGQASFDADLDGYEPIVDETLEPSLTTLDVDAEKVEEYLSKVYGETRKMDFVYSELYTKQLIAKSILDTLWKKGKFELSDIAIDAEWTWADRGTGSMAAFYNSVCAAADYLDALFIRLASYRYSTSRKDCGMSFKVAGSKKISSSSAVSGKLDSDRSSWIVYIPFDNCPYRLGGSLLQQKLGLEAGVVPQIGDADYFIDCYEVVRELVEDGVILSAATVGEGGLISALKGMTSVLTGAEIDITDLMRSTEETNPVRVLFAEIPGVIIQIEDMDFDYLDAELLLQDVAFFPLGHPCQGGAVHVKGGAKTGIQTILESLIRNQGAEGED